MRLRARLFSPLMGARRCAPRPQPASGRCRSSPGPMSHAWPALDFSARSSGEFRVSSDSPHTDLSYLRTTVQLASFCPQGLDQKRQQPEAQGSLCPRGNSQPMGQALGKTPQHPSPQVHDSRVCKKLLRGPQQHRHQGLPSLCCLLLPGITFQRNHLHPTPVLSTVFCKEKHKPSEVGTTYTTILQMRKLRLCLPDLG